MPTDDMRRPSGAAWIVFAVALGVRVALALRCEALPEYSDMELYNEAALAAGFPTTLPPGYPLFLRGVYALFGARNYTAVFVIQGALSALTVLLVYCVARRLATEAAGIAAAALAAVYPNLVLYNLTTLTETWGILVQMLLLAVLVAGIRETRRSILAAALLFLGFLFRPVMLFLLPGTWLVVRRRSVFIAAAAVLFVPVISYEMTVGRSFQRGAVALYETYHPKLDGSAFLDPAQTELGSEHLPSRVYLKTAWSYIGGNKARVIENIYNKTTVLFSSGWDAFVLQPIAGEGKAVRFLLEYAYLPVLVLGFVGMARRYGAENRTIALPVLGYLVLVILFSLFKFRYRLVVEPVLMIYAAMLLFPRRPAGAGQ